MPEDTRRDSGRPSIFSQELADAIFAQIGKGRGLSDICRDEGMPNRTTIYRWLAEDEAFRRQYAVACEIRPEHMGDQILGSADNDENEDTQRDRLRIDARKWLTAKLAPKKYGDKIVNEHSGPDGGDIPVKVTTDIDRAKALAALIARTRANAPTAG